MLDIYGSADLTVSSVIVSLLLPHQLNYDSHYFMFQTKFDLLQVGARDRGQTLESGIFHIIFL